MKLGFQHGRKAKTVYYSDDTQSNNDEKDLICSVEDNGEVWIIETREGIELARHNSRYLATIIWEDQL